MAARKPRRKVDARNLVYEISHRVALQARTRAAETLPGPRFRPLRIFTLDPSVSHRLGGIATAQVPYQPLAPGPVGALFEFDATGAPPPLTVAKLDLDDPLLLLSSGVSPSPGDARFHLQMAYAVCSLTYAAFQRALGRDVAWAVEGGSGQSKLRVRPFAVNEDNAYYSREIGLEFGYFKAAKRPGGHTVPGGLIFGGLSHDIVAHETTHALLDGLRAEFYAPTQGDVPGFHEGFADIVAILQHFSYPEVVAQGIREGRGDLANATLLSNLAQEFGYATSTSDRPLSMRSGVDVAGIEAFDSDALVPDDKLSRYRKNMEMHDIGAVLVVAVFEAFATVFRRKTDRFFRLAGIPSEGIGHADLPTELVQVLAAEASLLASQFLNVCIRAVDYCPPVDMELGEYLRAIVTADRDVVANDPWGYREALIRSFRRRGIFPDHVPFMSEDALAWSPPETTLRIPELAFERLKFRGDPARPASPVELARQARALGSFLSERKNAEALRLIVRGMPLPKGITYAAPPIVQSIRCARRVGPEGGVLFDLIAEVTQTCTAIGRQGPFEFFGGCTIVIGPSGEIRYVIYKRLGSENRRERQAAAMRGPLSRFWVKKRGVYVTRPATFKILHARAK
ncbi:MAG: peptidase M4 [Candidatus Eisenbacteria bacterium]|uniref:Peptidase M4 n=1 Tax=Eiseniibacteriota bacterium TaxID=2212470 RepID=A0A849SD20_UNCEI|nr:peptidase M4 [Candidatus Eisenbacteria bacterium]